MKTSRRLIIALAVGAVAMCATPLATAQTASGRALAARSNDAGGVRVVIKPKNVGSGSAWEFEVTMDTHSKPLDDDLTITAVLLDDGGRRYVPLTWQGDPPGGHHRKGVLRFPAPADQIKSFKIQIQGMGGVATRTFEWNMK